MKIIIASLLPPGNSSGYEKFIQILYKELKNQMIEVFLANRQFKNEFINYLIRFPSRVLNKLFNKSIWLGWEIIYSTTLVGLTIFLLDLRVKKITVIHAQDILAGYIALVLKPFFNYRLILTVHFNESVATEFIENKLIKRNGLLHKTIDYFEKTVLQEADHIIFVSAFMCKSLLNKYIMRDYSVIYNGTKRESKIRGKILENERKKILLNIGTLEKRKNQIFLIEMFSELLKMNNNYELWLIGGGEDGEKLKEAVDKKNIYSNVFFLGKVENVNEYLSKTFMYLHAALIENFSVALLEAQSFGIPIIAPPVGGIPELVKDGFNGYLLNTNEENIPNWVNKIEELAKNRSVYVELSKNSSFTFENNFTKEIMIKQYLGIYKSV